MIELPSGKKAGITNIRARYHATRRNLKIDEETPLTTLLQLVDIVESLPKGSSAAFHNEFVFSGHTLADFPHFQNWDEQDLELFHDWLENPSQYRQVEKARHRVVMDDLPIKVHEYDYPGLLYSCLHQRIEQLPLARASAMQWLGTLHNMQQDGLRPDELRWSGLERWLGNLEPHRMVTKDELLDGVDFSAIRLDITNELVGGGSCGLVFEEVAQTVTTRQLLEKGYELWPDERGLIRYQDNGYRYRIGMVRGGLRWFLLGPSGLPVDDEGNYRAGWFNAPKDAMDVAARHAREHFQLSLETRPCSRYEHKSLCGGEDYREWLVSLPDYSQSFFGSHYYERNLLLHFRTKRRVDTRGRRLLFIEEIQSDWHQSGAMHGYQNRWPGIIPVAPFRKEWVSLAMKFMLMHVAEQDLDGIAWTNGKEQAMHYGRDMAPVNRVYDQDIPRALQRLGSPWRLEIGSTTIATKEPRLHARRESGQWKVVALDGSFQTRPRYSQEEAIRLMARHCRNIELNVPLLLVPEAMKHHILELGLPLFGEQQPKIEQERDDRHLKAASR